VPRHVVATVDEIPAGERKRVTVDGRDVVVFNVKGEFLGLLDRCPHQGGSLCGGVLAGFVYSDAPGEYHYSRAGEFIRCPWHGWHFDLRTGQSWGDPERVYTKRFSVDATPGSALVEGPYKAETVEVQVDGNYVVVET
jgi:3-phenylpropionate/trans-cinnamate dioxygenase ferredoxin subunit